MASPRAVVRSQPTDPARGKLPAAEPWPDATQIWLLRAAIGDGDDALEAFARWRVAVDLTCLDAASQRLLPLTWWNLDRQCFCGPDLDALRRAFAKCWVRNQQISDALGTVLPALRAAGVPALLFKGAALALGTYPALGVRPMDDVDILVPPAATAEAVRVLGALGAQGTSSDPVQRQGMLHGNEFFLDFGGYSVAVDLHQSALWECRRPGDDDAFWSGSVALSSAAIEARTLSPADHLLVICIHGLRWSPVRPIHWVADALAILGDTQHPVEWTRLVAEAQRRRLSWPLAVALRFLVRTFPAPVPTWTIEELEADRPRMRDRLELAFRPQPPDLLRGLVLHWCDHARRSAIPSTLGRLVTFPGYLREMWALQSVRQLPAQTLRKLLRRRF